MDLKKPSRTSWRPLVKRLAVLNSVRGKRLAQLARFPGCCSAWRWFEENQKAFYFVKVIGPILDAAWSARTRRTATTCSSSIANNVFGAFVTQTARRRQVGRGVRAMRCGRLPGGEERLVRSRRPSSTSRARGVTAPPGPDVRRARGDQDRAVQRLFAQAYAWTRSMPGAQVERM